MTYNLIVFLILYFGVMGFIDDVGFINAIKIIFFPITITVIILLWMRRKIIDYQKSAIDLQALEDYKALSNKKDDTPNPWLQ